MMRYFSILLLVFLAHTVAAQKFEGHKAVIDQRKLYTVISRERTILLEIRDVDSPIGKVTYKLVPIRKMEDGRDIAWDVKDGYLYAINMMEQANMELGETLKRYKIEQLSDQVDHVCTTAEYLGNTYMVNQPIIDLFSRDVNRQDIIFDISVTDKVYIFVSNKSSMSSLYSVTEKGDWDKVDIQAADIKNICMENHSFYNEEIIFNNLDCADCPQLKAAREMKTYPMMLIDKTNHLVLALTSYIGADEYSMMSLPLFIQKNSMTYVFN